MNRLIILLSILSFTCAGCSKNKGDVDIDENRERAKTVLLMTRKVHSSGNLETILTAYNRGGKTIWKKGNLGASPGSFLYGSGLLYVCADGSLSAVHPDTGTEIWKHIGGQFFYNGMVVRNDTLYCSVIDGNNFNFIIAYRATTGILLWKQLINEPYSPGLLAFDGNVLYYLGHDANAVSNITALDLGRKKQIWKTDIGISMGSISIEVVQNDDKLFVTSGLRTLFALDKKTGNEVWAKEGLYLDRAIYGNNKIYTADRENGVFAWDPQTGDQVWHWKNQWFIAGQPYLQGKKLFLLGTNSTSDFLSCLNADNGSVEWNKTFNSTYQSHIVVGSEIFALKRALMNANATTSYIMSFDAANGNVKDSIEIMEQEIYHLGIITESGGYLITN